MSGAPANLDQYTTHFDELSVEEHELVVDINSVYPLSDLRDNYSQVTDEPSEYHLSTSANTNDFAYIESTQRGEYTAGFMCLGGIGVRVPTNPTGDSVMRWGYYEPSDGSMPSNGFWFGVDDGGLFVARSNSGSSEKVYQKDWNRDKLDSQYSLNPSGKTIDISDGLVFRINFTYYGYGPIEMRVLMDDDDDDQYGNAEIVTAHTFHVNGGTSIDNTNLPISATIEPNGTNNDALDLFVGGRQFSVVGKRTENERTSWHYLDSLTVDDTKWHHAISFQLKDGTDVSSTNFRKVLGTIRRFYAEANSTSYKWQIRRGTTPNDPVWGVPESHVDTPDESAYKVDTNSADVQDGSGDTTGVNLDGGILAEGSINETEIKAENIDGEIVDEEITSLLFKAKPTTSGSVSDILFKMGERW